MNKVKRILLVIVCMMFCISAVMIPSTARWPCTDPNGHSYAHASHGSWYTTGPTASYCYITKYTQCVVRCIYCDDSNLTTHDENGPGHIWVNRWKETGDAWQCSGCGYWREY